MARSCDVGGRRTLAQHLLNGVSGNEMNQEEDERNHQPNYRQGIEDALEEGSNHYLRIARN
jgi:hypothetical protein